MKNWLDFLYPPCCGFCGKEQESFVCESCLNYIKQEGLALEKYRKSKKEKYYDEIMWSYSYQKEIRNKIIAYKFEGQSYLHYTFSELLRKNKKIYAFLQKYDTILAVPMEKKKQALRGFSPTYLIARDLAREMEGLSFEKNCFKKIKRTKTQSTLGREERKINLIDAFYLQQPEKLKGKNVVLLDDVYTTGATIEECCKCLKGGNPNLLGVLIIAKD